ncbi:MAG: iron-sulfur cluster assembly protein [Halobacteriales archaeon]|nr:iron-sulfur cluster assembly protein [Halobacteriales archaeon]
MSDNNSDLEFRIREQLDEVLDPCSTFTEHPQSIVDLGLVDGVAIEDGDVTVDLLPTNQLCMYIPHMTDDIENRVGDIPAVDSVAVETVADKVWTQDRMADEAYEEREAHFRERVEAHDITPAYDGAEWSDDITSRVRNTEDREEQADNAV